MNSQYRESHLERNITLFVAGIIIAVVLATIYVAPDIAQRNLEKKEWRENATCEELQAYLEDNIMEFEYRSYQMIEKLREIRCLQS